MAHDEIIRKIKAGKIGVMPTDTLYALAGSALDAGAIDRIFQTKGRNPSKPLIILIRSLDDLGLFGIALSDKEKQALETLWPGKLSVILPANASELRYLHRGKRSLAFRMPDDKELLSLLAETGPLAVPSANPEGLPPARTIAEAESYFGQAVDFYWDKGQLEGKPSTLIRLGRNGFEILRQGAYDPERLKAALSSAP